MKDLLFGQYINDLNNIVHNKEVLMERTRAYSNFTGDKVNLSEGMTLGKPLAHIEPLRLLLNLPAPNISAGTHPNFTHIGYTHPSEDHYIVSVFMDVKSSTVFFDKYNRKQIALIIQTIQSAAIAITSLFNGHIQRLQYDGLFVYFGGKNISKETAIKNALNATSFFSYFIKYELGELLKAYDFDKISTRTGIDFGDDDQVTWCRFGVEDASEVTTVSLHTSLVPKMQSNAIANGIVIGENVRRKLLLDTYTSTVTYQENGKIVDDEYIYRNYRQHKFNWESWLVNNFNFVQRDGSKISVDYTYNPNSELKKVKNSDNQLLRVLGYANESTYISPAGIPNISNNGSIAPNNRNYSIE